MIPVYIATSKDTYVQKNSSENLWIAQHMAHYVILLGRVLADHFASRYHFCFCGFSHLGNFWNKSQVLFLIKKGRRKEKKKNSSHSYIFSTCKVQDTHQPNSYKVWRDSLVNLFKILKNQDVSRCGSSKLFKTMSRYFYRRWPENTNYATFQRQKLRQVKISHRLPYSQSH